MHHMITISNQNSSVIHKNHGSFLLAELRVTQGWLLCQAIPTMCRQVGD